MYVFILDPDNVYCKSLFCAILLATCAMLRAATLMCVFLYCLHIGFKDLHILLCSFGFHFFSAEAIVCLNYANGWSAPMKIRHRKFAHVFLQICGLICSITGFVLVIIAAGNSSTPHGITGTLTMALAVAAAIVGTLTFIGKKVQFYIKIVHMSIAIPTFLAFSICICTGFLTEAFKSWATETVSFILIGFVSFYTAFIVVTLFMKCVSRI